MIQMDLSHIRQFIPLPYEEARAAQLRLAHSHLQHGDGAGGEFTGWVQLPRQYDREEFARIQAAARKIQQDSQALVVIGIGGSYLGARGVIECLCSPNYNLKKKDTPQHLLHRQRPVLRPDGGAYGPAGGGGLLRQRHLQVRHHHGACGGLPFLPEAAGGAVRPRGGGPAHLRHHRPPQRGR